MGERREALRDLVALFSIACFVVGGALAPLFLFLRTAAQWFGPIDEPMGYRAIPFAIAILVVMTLGSLAAGMGWILVMSRFSPKRTMHKWVTYGPQFKPLLSLNLRLLDRAYRGRIG